MANKERASVESGLSDILGNVIQSDRRRAGRGEDQANTLTQYDSNTSPIAISEYDNNTIGQYDNNTVTQDIPATEKTADPTRKAPPKQAAKEKAKPDVPLLQSRVEEAESLASSPTMTITLRIPSALNEWLDEYVHGSWPEKVKKQQLVTEALQLLFARRGRPKEEILPTPFLPENE